MCAFGVSLFSIVTYTIIIIISIMKPDCITYMCKQNDVGRRGFFSLLVHEN